MSAALGIPAIGLLKDFFSLLYPDVCLCCGESLGGQEEFVCTICIYKLPKTDFHLKAENDVTRLFHGRVEIKSAASYCYFQTGNSIQKLVHELKYKGKKELGEHLGKWYGNDLRQSPYFKHVEVVVPVPLHKNKLRRRGYNQSAFFAKGLAESMGVTFDEKGLIRKVDTATQTRKSRLSRWENVKDIFSVPDGNAFEGKHVLVADDIITTGATLEACIHALHEAKAASVSVASIGYALL